MPPLLLQCFMCPAAIKRLIFSHFTVRIDQSYIENMKNSLYNLTARARRAAQQNTADFVIFIEIRNRRETILQHPVASVAGESVEQTLDLQLKIFSQLLPGRAISAYALAAEELTEAERSALSAYRSAINLLKQKLGRSFLPPFVPAARQLNVFDLMKEDWAKLEAEQVRLESKAEKFVLTGFVKREYLTAGRRTTTVSVSCEPLPKAGNIFGNIDASLIAI